MCKITKINLKYRKLNFNCYNYLFNCRDIDKRIVSLPEIRETGEYIAELKLHPDVTAQVRLNVFAN